MVTCATSQLIQYSSFSYLSHEQFGGFKLLMHLVQLIGDVHSGHGHFWH